MKYTSLPYLVLCLAGSLALTGCSANFAGSPVSNATTPIGNIRGVAYGGQQPIVGAEIFLFGIGTSAYNGTSISLLNSSGNTFYETGTGNYYALTDSNGEFNISGDYNCTPGQVVYLYSINGNPGIPGGGSYGNNAAASLMATLGTCPTTGTFANQTSYVYMNEVSTVATAFAFEAYATNARNISIGPVGSGTGPSALALKGLQNAADNAQKLYNISGNVALAGANSVTPAGNGVVPNALINTLADILAGCINSTGPSSAGCSQLFGYMPGNANTNSGITPNETATAAIYLAKNPGTNVVGIYGLKPTNPVFTPQLNSQPNDFTIGITYTDSSLSAPNDIAIDSQGAVWVTNPGSNTVTKLSPTGVASSFSVPSANFLTIDTSDNVWVTSTASTPGVYELNNSGTQLGHYTANYAMVTPAGLANDGANTYVADTGLNVVDPFGPLGGTPTDVNGDTYSQSTGLSSVQYVTTDVSATAGNGYIWATSESGLVCRFFSTGGNAGCFRTSGLTKPERIGIDASSYAWIPDAATNKLYKFTGQNGVGLVKTSFTGGGLSTPVGVALDGNASVFVANSDSSDSISKFTTSGTALSPSTGYTSGLTGSSIGHKNLAIDGSGDVWLANTLANSVTEVIGVAAPVVTPLSAGAATSTIATKP
jgi:hypothetical protein